MPFTDHGREMTARLLWADSEAAVFHHVQMITDWQPVELNDHIVIDAPQTFMEGVSVRVRSKTDPGTYIEFPAWTAVRRGDTIHLPPLKEWFA